MSKDLPERPSYTYTEDDWVQMRAHFMGSILVDIHLHKLAQNIGAAWPPKGKDETPAKYLEYSFDELPDAPGLAGQPARLQLLLDILKETASFDDPFQDMIETAPSPTKSAANTDQLLQKLHIPPQYPIDFTALSADTRELSRSEGATTIGQCIALFQGMAQSVIMGGEVRHLLNSVAHTDGKALAEFLPLRAGSPGLHLAEAVGILIRNLPEAQQTPLLNPAAADEANVTAAEETLFRDLPALLEWFPEETAALRESFTTGQGNERFFHPLGDPALEQAAARTVHRHFAPPPVAPVEEKKPTGFMQRMTSLFRSNR